MLSSLLMYKLVDSAQTSLQLQDFIVDISANIYPPVKYLVWKNGNNEPFRTPWSQVIEIDELKRIIKIQDENRGIPLEAAWFEKAVLLKRDILDSLILDLESRSPVLANDLRLELGSSQMTLTGIDIGMKAILRRLSGSLWFRRPEQGVCDWKYVEFLRGNPQAPLAGLEYHGLIARLPAGEIAYLADMLPYLYAAELLTFLPDPVAADTLEIMMPTLQLQAFAELDHDKANRLLALMRPDVVADLLSELDPGEARSWLEQIPQQQYERVLQLLRYPPDTAGGIMTNDMITLPETITVEEALPILKDTLSKPDFINFIQYLYVVEDSTSLKLKGVFSVRDLLIANPQKQLKEIMDPYIITLPPMLKADQAARRVVESAKPALPVIDQNGKIVGIVTVDSAIDLVLPKTGRREILRLYS